MNSVMLKKTVGLLIRAVLLLSGLSVTIFITVILAGAVAANKRAALSPWHTVVLESEFTAEDSNVTRSLDDYLQQEREVFEEMHLKVISRIQPEDQLSLNRYVIGSRSNPERIGRNWNRSYERVPDEIRGGALLLHGMTDSPYSLRHFAESLHEQGIYVLNLRLPAHGTVPAALAQVDWQDWYAAVKLGARHVRSRIKDQQPFYILGYSNGAGLAVMFALDAITQDELPRPDQLFLISPMLAVSGLARLSKYYFWIGKLGWFEKSLWLDIYPEYDPHKYNSFPMNAPRQSRAFTETLNARLAGAVKSGVINQMPPITAFQSLVDATVIARATVDRLYRHLPENGSELVLFDINRIATVEAYIRPEHDALRIDFINPQSTGYTRTLITNASGNTTEIVEMRRVTGELTFTSTPLDTRWPKDFISLSHVALPFPLDDEIYGRIPAAADNGFPHIGLVQLVGEGGTLVLPPSLQTRARSNPFYDYIEQRINAVVTAQ